MRHIVVMKPGEAGKQLYDKIKSPSSGNKNIHFWPAFTFRLPSNSEEVKNQLMQAVTEGSTIVIVSPNAALLVKQLVPLWSKGVHLAAPGKPTAEKIHELWGDEVDVLSPEGGSITSGSELLYEKLLQKGLPKKVVIARGQTGRDFLYEELSRHGVEVKKLVVYERIPLVLQESEKTWINDLAEPPMVYLTSSDSIDILFRNLSTGQQAIFRKARFLTIHQRIRERLKSVGCQNIALIDSTEVSTSKAILQFAAKAS